MIWKHLLYLLFPAFIRMEHQVVRGELWCHLLQLYLDLLNLLTECLNVLSACHGSRDPQLATEWIFHRILSPADLTFAPLPWKYHIVLIDL